MFNKFIAKYKPQVQDFIAEHPWISLGVTFAAVTITIGMLRVLLSLWPLVLGGVAIAAIVYFVSISKH